MHCSNCQAILAADARFCSSCGNPIVEVVQAAEPAVGTPQSASVSTTESSEPAKRSFSRRKVAIIGTVLVCLLAVAQIPQLLSSARLESDLRSVRTLIEAGDVEAARTALQDTSSFDSGDPRVEELDQLLKLVEASTVAFRAGQTAQSGGDSATAVDWFMKVSEKDVANYSRANASIEALLPEVISDGLSEVASLESSGDLGQAAALLAKLESLAPTNSDVTAVAATIRAKQAAKIAADEEAARKLGKAALDSLRSSRDEFKQVRWLEDPSSPRYVNQDGFYVYIGKYDDGTSILRLKIQYEDDDWLFIESFQIKADGAVYDIDPAYGDVERDNDSRIWEWYDTVVTEYEREMLEAVVKAKKVQIRFNGSQYYDTQTLSARQKRAIVNVLRAYDYLNRGSTSA